MNFATLVIGDWNWMLPAGGFALAGAVLLWLVYRGLSVTRTVRWSAAGLKATGIALLAICLVEPLWSGTRARPGANIFLIVADNSQSLRIRDPRSSTSRGDGLKNILDDDQAPWRVRLNQDFDVRRYLVDSRLRRTDDFSQLDFKGTATSLATTLKTLRERFQDRPLA